MAKPCTSPIHPRSPDGSFLTVPCGRCKNCLSRRRDSWGFRLKQELKRSTSAHFVTLTYDETTVPMVDDIPVLHKPDLQKFMKLLRHKSDNQLKYYAIGEYGDHTMRPHYHLILYNLTPPATPQLTAELEIIKSWKKGHVKVGPVTNGRIYYVVSYLFKKKHTPLVEFPAFSVMSKGLGDNYIDVIRKQQDRDDANPYFCIEGAKKIPMPRYYSNKLYSPESRAAHARECQRLAAMRSPPEPEYGTVEFDDNLRAKWLAACVNSDQNEIQKNHKQKI